MRKVFAVAGAEYRSVVLTKSFLFSLLIPFLLYGGMILAGVFLGDKTDLEDRVLMVVDQTGGLIEPVREANTERNRSSSVIRNGKQIGPKFIIEPYDADTLPETKVLLVELSDQRKSANLGRADDNDLVIKGNLISRIHAKVEMRRGKFMLIDQSTNGTFLTNLQGEETFVRRDTTEIHGEGTIGLGRAEEPGASLAIHFKTLN